jgi:hypothetical protein
MYQSNVFENVEDLGNVEQSAINKLSKDLKEATRTLTQSEARFLVDYYYQLQNDRIRAKNQVRSMSDEPNDVILWLSDNTAVLEKQIAVALQKYAESNFVGRWSMSICGVAGVISAGLLAHIDITKASNVGHIYSFAGILPNPREWKKGMKRPFNAKLKVLCWKIGESFVKVSNNKNDFYGKVYQRAKVILQEKNERGEYAGQCENILESKNFGKDTEAYKAYIQGKLPPAHIQERAKRKAVQLFLSHWWEVAFRHNFPERECPKPYAIDHLGHFDYVEMPNNPF